MKKINLLQTTINKGLLAILLVSFTVVSCQKEDHLNPGDERATKTDNTIQFTDELISGQYIVHYHNDFEEIAREINNQEYGKVLLDHHAKQKIVSEYTAKVLSESGIEGAEVLQVYTNAVSGFTIKMDKSLKAKLSMNKSVSAIESDMRVRILNNNQGQNPPGLGGEAPGRGGENPARGGGQGNNNRGGGKGNDHTEPQIAIDWAADRIGTQNYSGNNRAWVFDTGIDPTHPKLNVNTTLSRNFTGSDSTAWDDTHGHGTYVAGIIAATGDANATDENAIRGIAKGAELVSVKVLGSNGGALSEIIAGIDYVINTASSGDVANFSLGGCGGGNLSLDLAVRNLANEGVFVSIASGNNIDDVQYCSPARAGNHSGVYTVAAMAEGDIWYERSNHDPSTTYSNDPASLVQFIAPGADVISTYIGGGYVTFSGTSASAPVIAGILLNHNGSVPDNDDWVERQICSRTHHQHGCTRWEGVGQFYLIGVN